MGCRPRAKRRDTADSAQDLITSGAFGPGVMATWHAKVHTETR